MVCYVQPARLDEVKHRVKPKLKPENHSMVTIFKPGVALSSMLLAGMGWSCSSEEPESSGDECNAECPRTEGADLSSPSVSFAADVVPIFVRNCNDDLCHGFAEAPRANLYLGPEAPATSEQIQAVHAGLTRASRTAPAMMLVTPGAPQQSFLMLKVDGCQNSLGLTCDAEPNSCRADCGDPMPPLPRDVYPELSQNEKLTLRRWIAQGAGL